MDCARVNTSCYTLISLTLFHIPLLYQLLLLRMLVPRFFLVKPQGAWKNRKLKWTRKRTAETEIPKQLLHSAATASSVASCSALTFTLTLMGAVLISAFPSGRHCSLDINVNWKESWADHLQLYEQLFNTRKSYVHVAAWYNCYFSLLRFASGRYFTTWEELHSAITNYLLRVTSCTSCADHGYSTLYSTLYSSLVPRPIFW